MFNCKIAGLRLLSLFPTPFELHNRARGGRTRGSPKGRKTATKFKNEKAAHLNEYNIFGEFSVCIFWDTILAYWGNLLFALLTPGGPYESFTRQQFALRNNALQWCNAAQVSLFQLHCDLDNLAPLLPTTCVCSQWEENFWELILTACGILGELIDRLLTSGPHCTALTSLSPEIGSRPCRRPSCPRDAPPPPPPAPLSGSPTTRRSTRAPPSGSWVPSSIEP